MDCCCNYSFVAAGRKKKLYESDSFHSSPFASRCASASSKFASCIILISTTIYFCTRMRNKTFPRRMDGWMMILFFFERVRRSLLDATQWDDEVEVKNQSKSSFNVTRRWWWWWWWGLLADLTFSFFELRVEPYHFSKLFLPLHHLSRTNIVSRPTTTSMRKQGCCEGQRSSNDIEKRSLHRVSCI